MGAKGSKPKGNSVAKPAAKNGGSNKFACFGKRKKQFPLPPPQPIKPDESAPPTLELDGRQIQFRDGVWVEDRIEANWEALSLRRDILQMQEKSNQLKFKNALLMDMVVLTNLDAKEIKQDLVALELQTKLSSAQPAAVPFDGVQGAGSDGMGLSSTMPSSVLESTTKTEFSLGGTGTSEPPNVGGFLLAE